MNIGGILAGGTGSRMAHADLPKQFMEIGGVPILVRTVRRFLQIDRFDHIIIAMNEHYLDYARELLLKNSIDMGNIEIILGGSSRFESLLCLCRKAQELCPDGEECILLNHDCARPFVSQQILLENLDRIREYDMVTTSLPTIDTVLISEDGKTGTRVPDRHTIFCDQGPQVIRVGHFLELVNSLTDEEKLKYIEAGRLYMEKGFRVGICTGNRMNFKITNMFDLTVAECLVRETPDL